MANRFPARHISISFNYHIPTCDNNKDWSCVTWSGERKTSRSDPTIR